MTTLNFLFFDGQIHCCIYCELCTTEMELGILISFDNDNGHGSTSTIQKRLHGFLFPHAVFGVLGL